MKAMGKYKKVNIVLASAAAVLAESMKA